MSYGVLQSLKYIRKKKNSFCLCTLNIFVNLNIFANFKLKIYWKSNETELFGLQFRFQWDLLSIVVRYLIRIVCVLCIRMHTFELTKKNLIYKYIFYILHSGTWKLINYSWINRLFNIIWPTAAPNTFPNLISSQAKVELFDFKLWQLRQKLYWNGQQKSKAHSKWAQVWVALLFELRNSLKLELVRATKVWPGERARPEVDRKLGWWVS